MLIALFIVFGLIVLMIGFWKLDYLITWIGGLIFGLSIIVCAIIISKGNKLLENGNEILKYQKVNYTVYEKSEDLPFNTKLNYNKELENKIKYLEKELKNVGNIFIGGLAPDDEKELKSIIEELNTLKIIE